MKHDQSSKIDNFDVVRLGLALIVVISHAASLTREPEFYWFKTVFDSYFAVKGFFVISGYLVIQSYLSSRSLGHFFEKRFRRIYPAYLAAIVLCLIIGSIATTLTPYAFATSAETIRYLAANLTLLNFFQHDLPGVFESHHTSAMNGSLWTIKIEVCLYLCIPLIYALHARIGATITAMALVTLSAAWSWYFISAYNGVFGEELARQFPGYMSYFALGACLGVGRMSGLRSTSGLLASASAYYLTQGSTLSLVTQPVFYTVLVLYLATAIRIPLSLSRFGDLSYGSYLYHFPVIQLFIWAGFYEHNAWIGLIGSVAVTLIISYISWHLLEKRLLRRSRAWLVSNVTDRPAQRREIT